MVPSNYWQGDSHEATRNIVLRGTRRELQRSSRQENPRERDPARGTCARGKDHAVRILVVARDVMLRLTLARWLMSADYSARHAAFNAAPINASVTLFLR